ncbi:translation initiation factor 2 [Actinoplanes philippinensis]|uniref:translation initiation factor 2 n=1 Tax=Actinoplanes philippinensis TaxID=35752 RepID=UPI0033ED6A08
MFHQHFLSLAGTDLGPLDSGERILWRGRCAVAEYAFDEASSLPRWTLPEETDVIVTDRRVRYVHDRDDTHSSGELFWLWPQHLRVQPGNRETGRNGTVTQIQLVCKGPEGTFPALVFAGGELSKINAADHLANTMRQAIARFRVENADLIGVPAVQARMLSRLVIGPEFSNHLGGKGQTVTLLGEVAVPGPDAGAAPAPDEPALPEPAYQEQAYQQEPAYQQAPAYQQEPAYAEPAFRGPGYREQTYQEPAHRESVYQEPVYQQAAYQEPVYQEQAYQEPVSGANGWSDRPGVEADALRAEEAMRAEQDSRQSEPDLASRAASLAARVANLVSQSPDDGQTTNLSSYLNRDR